MATNTHLLDEQDDVLHQPQAPTQPAPEQAAQEHHEPANPAVALLKAMFPDFDDAVLQSVLESVNGNQDAAIDVLLGMSDPSYVSTHQPAAHTEQGANPSLDLDEALARQLQLEDERGHQQARGQSWQPRQPRRSSNPDAAAQGQGQQPGSPGQQGDQMQEIKETFNQLAESGKRTFSSIVSRVKAKINEYDQNRTGGQSSSQHPPPNWGYNQAPQQPPSAQGSPNPASYPSYYAEAPSQPADRHSASQAYAQYYNHEADEDDEGWQSVSGRGRTTSPKAVTEQPKPIEVRGYDVDSPEPEPAAPPAAAAAPIATPAPVAAHSEQQEPLPAAPSSPGSDVPRPPATQSGSPLNAAKFGLLPKRPVSLLTPQASAARHPDDDDDDDLEYAENPFEESRH